AAANRANKDDVRIRGMHDDARDAAGFLQAHVGPVLAGVDGLVDAVAHGIAFADQGILAGASPDDAGVRRRDGESADGLNGLLVKNRRPAIAAVGGLPDAAGRGARVVSAGIARHTDRRRDAIADSWADKTKSESALVGGIGFLRACGNHASENGEEY